VLERDYNSEFRHAGRRLTPAHAPGLRSAAKCLIESVKAELDGALELSPAEAGIQLIGWLPDGLDDNAVSRAAAARGVSVVPLSFYYRAAPRRRGLFLGFGGTPPDQMRANVRRLAEAIHAVQNHPRE